jgi:hypothetical protein
MAAKTWTNKAEAIIRKRITSEFLTLDGLRDFIKNGEKLLGMLVMIDCSEGTSASGKDNAQANVPSTEDAAAMVTDTGDGDDQEGGARSSSSRSVNTLPCVQLLADLRAELKKGKGWYQRLQATGADKGAAVAAEVLEPLLAEIDTICVDFTEQKGSLEQGTQRYCFCRQAYHGQMIGCEECDDWFHLNCIGLTKIQADKIDKYICLRCTIRQSFHTTAVNVAMITNRWMSNDELLKWREMRRSKAIRKKVKEERDIHRYQVQINEITESVRMRFGKGGPSSVPKPPPSLATLTTFGVTEGDTPMDTVPSSTGSPVGAAPSSPDPAAAPVGSVDDMIQEQTRPIRDLMRSATTNLQLAMDEENLLMKELDAEKVKVPMVREWMQAMQGVLWPGNKEDLEIGRPIQPPGKTSSSSSSANNAARDEFSVTELGLDRGLLSEGMQKAHCAAVALNIHLIEDVIQVFEGFKWMSWLCLFLHSLRRPMPTRAMRLFIEAYKPLKLQDEKVTKPLQSWYQRAA